MNEINIDFKPSEKQYYALQILTDNVHTEIGYGGGAGSGKSFLGCFWLLINALRYPKTQWLMGRKELTKLKKTTLMSMFKLCNLFDVDHRLFFKVDYHNNLLRFRNGSIIFMMDLDNMPSDPMFQRLGSLELTGAFVDESGELSVQAINILKTRLGRSYNDKYGLTPKLLETFNPTKNHIYTRYYKPHKEKTEAAHSIFIPALVTDNPYIDSKYIEQLRNADEITKQRLLYGNFEYDDDDTKLIQFDKCLAMFENVMPKTFKKYLSCDISRMGKDKTVIMLWDGLYAEKIFYFNKKLTTETAEIIKNIAKENNVSYENIIVDEDGVGGGVQDMLAISKGFVNNSSCITEKGKVTNYANLKSQCYYKLAEYINTGRIGICCTDIKVKEDLIQELEMVRRKNADKDGKLDIIPKDKIKEMIGRSPDFADALMMRMYFEIDNGGFMLLEDDEGLLF